jgi:hypothetical protein
MSQDMPIPDREVVESFLRKCGVTSRLPSKVDMETSGNEQANE